MTGSVSTYVVIAKRPAAGRVKTRLCPPLSPDEAANLAAAALADTLLAVDDTRVAGKVLCFDGDPTGWLRPGWTHEVQRPGGLDARLAHALANVAGPAAVVGMDTPQLTGSLLSGFDPGRYDACLGPTADGGYWILGLRDTDYADAALLGIPMSTGGTYARQLERLHSLGLSVQILDTLIDVDTYSDACAVAGDAPRTRFAAAFAELEAGAA